MRYSAAIEFYVYADSEKDAIEQAKQIANNIDKLHDNRANVIEVAKGDLLHGNYQIIHPKITQQ